MKIAYIALKGMPLGGGIEKYTEELGSRLVKRGHEVLVYCSTHYNTTPGRYKGMQIRLLPSINTKSWQKLSLTLLSSLHQFLEREIDIVHYHAVGPSLFAFMPRLMGRKTVVQIHGLEWKRAKWGVLAKTFFKLNDYSAMYFPNKITAVSQVLKQHYEKRFGREVVYIPTGVNRVERKSPKKMGMLGLQRDGYIFFASRLVAEKGAHYLIDAFNELDTGLKLVIAGDAQHEERYKALLLDKARHNRDIIFTGFIQGELLEELFSNALIFVQPSEIEGLPISLLEAMSYGNCCLASDIPENREALDGCGYFFKNKDYRDLKRMLQLLLESPSLIEEKRRIAPFYVQERYSWDKIADQFELLYQDLLDD